MDVVDSSSRKEAGDFDAIVAGHGAFCVLLTYRLTMVRDHEEQLIVQEADV